MSSSDDLSIRDSLFNRGHVIIMGLLCHRDHFDDDSTRLYHPLVLSDQEKENQSIGCSEVRLIRQFSSQLVARTWNARETVPRGFYFSLGSEDGASLGDFWIGINPLLISMKHCNIFNNYRMRPLLHLYVNPTARRDWCQANQKDLDLPVGSPPPYVSLPQYPHHKTENIPTAPL